VQKPAEPEEIEPGYDSDQDIEADTTTQEVVSRRQAIHALKISMQLLTLHASNRTLASLIMVANTWTRMTKADRPRLRQVKFRCLVGTRYVAIWFALYFCWQLFTLFFRLLSLIGRNQPTGRIWSVELFVIVPGWYPVPRR
jgi:hypothetical protein